MKGKTTPWFENLPLKIYTLITMLALLFPLSDYSQCTANHEQNQGNSIKDISTYPTHISLETVTAYLEELKMLKQSKNPL